MRVELYFVNIVCQGLDTYFLAPPADANCTLEADAVTHCYLVDYPNWNHCDLLKLPSALTSFFCGIVLLIVFNFYQDELRDEVHPGKMNYAAFFGISRL